MTSAATAPAKQVAIVTKDELAEIVEYQAKLAKAKKVVSDTEKEVKFRLLRLAETALGIKTEAELKELAPEQVQRIFAKRLTKGDWKLERGAPVFMFSKTNEGRYPSWAQLYAQELGETSVAKIKAETPVTYSYCVEVTAQ
jgi:hypothetical protein